jgi:hypothetical protein
MMFAKPLHIWLGIEEALIKMLAPFPSEDFFYF